MKSLAVPPCIPQSFINPQLAGTGHPGPPSLNIQFLSPKIQQLKIGF